jgi:hypothetical protein
MFQVCDDGVLLFISHTHTHTHTYLHKTFCINSFLLKTHSISKTGSYSLIRSSINIKKLCLFHSVKSITPRNGASRVSSQFLHFGWWRKQNTLRKTYGVFNKWDDKEKGKLVCHLIILLEFFSALSILIYTFYFNYKRTLRKTNAVVPKNLKGTAFHSRHGFKESGRRDLGESKQQWQDRKAKLGFIQIGLSELFLKRSSQWRRHKKEWDNEHTTRVAKTGSAILLTNQRTSWLVCQSINYIKVVTEKVTQSISAEGGWRGIN